MADTITILADNLDQARAQAKSGLQPGYRIASENVVCDGRPQTIEAEGSTAEEALAKLDAQVPGGATGIERRIVRQPGRRTLVVEAFDEQAAGARIKEGLESYEEIDAIRLAAAGSKGVFGIGKKPNQYEGSIAISARAALAFRQKAKIEVTYGLMSLRDAVEAKDLPTFEKLLAAQANVNEKEHGQDTPLMLAAMQGSVEMVRLLLAAGADPNATQKHGRTALSLADERGHSEVVRLFYSAYLADLGSDDGMRSARAESVLYDASQAIVPDLCDLLQHSPSERARRQSAWIIYKIAPRITDPGLRDQAEAALIEALGDSDEMVRGNAAWGLSIIGGRKAAPALQAAAKDRSPDVRDAVDNALVQLALAGRGGRSQAPREVAGEVTTPAITPAAVVSAASSAGALSTEIRDRTIPVIPRSILTLALVDSRSLGDAGAGAASFQQAIRSWNEQNLPAAESHYRQALRTGVAPLHEGYAHANLGAILLKRDDLIGAMEQFLQVFAAPSALYESVHEPAEYMSIILAEVGRAEEAALFRQLADKTGAKLGSRLASGAAAHARELARKAQIR